MQMSINNVFWDSPFMKKDLTESLKRGIIIPSSQSSLDGSKFIVIVWQKSIRCYFITYRFPKVVRDNHYPSFESTVFGSSSWRIRSQFRTEPDKIARITSICRIAEYNARRIRDERRVSKR